MKPDKLYFWRDATGEAYITNGEITLPAQEYNEKYLKIEDLEARQKELIEERNLLELKMQLLNLRELIDDINKDLNT